MWTLYVEQEPNPACRYKVSHWVTGLVSHCPFNSVCGTDFPQWLAENLREFDEFSGSYWVVCRTSAWS